MVLRLSKGDSIGGSRNEGDPNTERSTDPVAGRSGRRGQISAAQVGFDQSGFDQFGAGQIGAGQGYGIG